MQICIRFVSRFVFTLRAFLSYTKAMKRFVVFYPTNATERFVVLYAKPYSG